MRHRILTCKNHPELRWSTKDIAWSDSYGYNGSRNIFFCGTPTGEGMHFDNSGLKCRIIHPQTGEIVTECACSAKDLILAPEDAQVAQ